jgi:hypothetical protein
MRLFVVHFKTEAKGNGCQFVERQNGFWRRASTLGRIEGCAKWLQASAHFFDLIYNGTGEIHSPQSQPKD